MRVLKFGGKSLDTKEKFKAVCNFIKKVYNQDKELVIVVSAIGDTTNKLIEQAREFGNNTKSNRELAILLSSGETQSASLFAMHLNSIDVPSKSFSGKDIELTTFGDINNGKIAYINKKKIVECLKNKIVTVIAGFQGVNQDGEITTLGRGGSDTTAVALATVFGVDAEIYSDFNGVFSGDPRKDKYKKLKCIDFKTMMIMSKSGAKVLCFRATKLASKFNTKIISKSSSKPMLNGTIIYGLETDVINLAIKENLCKISIIFSNNEKLNFILENVLNCLISINFYNLTISDNLLEFYVEQEKSKELSKLISKKLNLLSKK